VPELLSALLDYPLLNTERVPCACVVQSATEARSRKAGAVHSLFSNDTAVQGGRHGAWSEKPASCKRNETSLVPRCEGRCADATLWVFVGVHTDWGSFAVRGHQTAELMERYTRTRSDASAVEVMSCETACGKAAQARFNDWLAQPCGDTRLLVTHVKFPCRCLQQSHPSSALHGDSRGRVWSKVAHVYDLVHRAQPPIPPPAPTRVLALLMCA
jgi:hypothetical protein